MQMQLKFEGQSVIQVMHFPPADKLAVADLQPVLDSVKAKSEAVSKLREIYRSTLITIHMYSDALGHNSYDGLLRILLYLKATSSGVPRLR